MGTRSNRIAEAVLTNICFEQKYEHYQSFLSEFFSVFGGEIFDIFELACLRNGAWRLLLGNFIYIFYLCCILDSNPYLCLHQVPG